METMKMQNKEARTDNRRLAQWRVKWLIEHSTSHQLLWCIDSFVLRNPPLRQAPNRYSQFSRNYVHMENPEILYKNHLKIYVLLKDKVIFESELEKQEVEYYCDIYNQPMFENGIRYFIQDIDRMKLDKILIENKIIAHTETILISDYHNEKKNSKNIFKSCWNYNRNDNSDNPNGKVILKKTGYNKGLAQWRVKVKI